MTRPIHIVLLSLLSAGVLTFCAPKPASAAAYVPCAKAVTDANNLIEFIGSLPEAEATAALTAVSKTEYGKVLLSIATDAAKSGNRREYIRAWHSACLKLSS